jgi:homocysteine S-methyltransferase
MQNIKTYLEKQPLLFDGAMGTYYAAQDHQTPCEKANLTAPEAISQIHKAYLAAGCRAIKTNTFGANRPALGEEACRQVLEAGWRIAKEAAGDEAYVFADMGPIQVTDQEDLLEEYRFVVDVFLSQGAEHFLFETASGLEGLSKTAAYIKEKNPDAYVIVSFAAQPDGFTRSGRRIMDLIAKAQADPNVDAVGLNCVSGPKHMVELVSQLGTLEKPLSVMPNAGYPTVLGGRTFYEAGTDYFADQLARIVSGGAKIVGGCCGTTPAHMAAAAKVLGTPAAKQIPITPKAQPEEKPQPAENPFWDALCDPTKKPFAVELDPPEAADVTKFISGAKELRDSGAAIITIADCPIARARMDSSILACKLRRELGVQALPHMTCRDRNLNATKALLLGLCAEDVHNVLVVTGDPVPAADRSEVKSVYNFNSRMLARYITGLGESGLPTPFRVFGALNLNARNFNIQLDLALEKQKNGVSGFLTQPVLTAQALENLKLARKTLDGKILGGIIPVVSQRNAQFMNAEVSGITVDPQITAMYEGADRAKGEELAIRISAAIAKEIEPYIDGYYLMTPFGRTNLMARIMEEIRKNS